MTINHEGLELIKSFEGCRLTAYTCPAGVLTIGYGHTKNVKKNQKITLEQAEAYLLEDIKSSEAAVNKLLSVYPHMNINQYSALVSFTFNCGEGNLKKLTSGRSLETIASKILLYNKANGQTLAGLVRRRKAEHDLFIKVVPKQVVAKKSDEEIAEEVIQGIWGNGTARKNLLTAAGYNYSTIQKIVNQMLKEVK